MDRIMRKDDYQAPNGSPGPQLADFMDSQDARITFRSADRLERSDPFGLETSARPEWLEPTPKPQQRTLVEQTLALEPTPGSIPAVVRPRPHASNAAFTWVITAVLLGMFAAVVRTGWMAFNVDGEGLVPTPVATIGEPVNR